MQEPADSSTKLSSLAKFGYGAALPVLVLVFCQALLILSLDSSGSWDGIGLALGSLVIVPGMLVANCWVLGRPWNARGRIFGAGLALPAILVFVEFLWLHGGPFRRIINAAFVAPFVWVWLFALLFFVPLVVTIARGKKRNKGTIPSVNES
jgi:hypothetical protein